MRFFPTISDITVKIFNRSYILEEEDRIFLISDLMYRLSLQSASSSDTKVLIYLRYLVFNSLCQSRYPAKFPELRGLEIMVYVTRKSACALKADIKQQDLFPSP